jgi:single-strand DNA-binding protein
MAAQPNEVTLVGNVTRDPELKFTNGGQAVADFGVAYNTRKKTSSGDWEDGEPQFFDITCWGQLAENVAESITKGTRCVVVGRLEQRTWETKEGDKRSKVSIVAEEVSPSLRWATCEVSRNEKRDGGGGGGRSSGGGGGGRSSSGGGGRGDQGGGYDPNEEPF